MPLPAGSRLGPYEILAPIGAGGMGEVYKARDTRLDRTVAIKVVKGEFSERFEREARAISALNHPNICTLYDVGSEDGTAYLVMEHVEGKPLKGPLPVDEALRYAVQIADALDSAHRRGIIHRDLKPSNILVTRSGIKLLDFGLAKFAQPESRPADLTLTTPLTGQGTILGTLQYMAPEQLEGKEADARSDIFGFGLVLYEMLTGKRAFEATSQASLIAAVLTSQPTPISVSLPSAPPKLDRIVQACLAKAPDERWQSAHDVKLELRWVEERVQEGVASQAVVSKTRGREKLAWGVALLMLVAAAYVSVVHFRSVPPPLQMVRSSLPPPPNWSFVPYSFAVSPDGTRLAFVAVGPDGKNVLWVRALSAPSAQQLNGTEGASFPFWSPDSHRIGFFTLEGKLKTADIAGGGVQILCDAQVGRGGAWNRDGEIIFAPTVAGPLHRVPAAGGLPAPGTRIPREGSGQAHRWPSFLPDSKHFLYFVDWSAPSDHQGNGIYVGLLDASEAKLVSAELVGNVVFASGNLLYVRDRTLMAQPFDPERLQTTGPPVPITQQELETDTGFSQSGFSVSQNGVLALQSAADSASHLVWADRSGKELGQLPETGYKDPRLSPDGRRVAVSSDDARNGRHYIRVYDLARGITTRLTDAGNDEFPTWSSDGKNITYVSTDGKAFYIYQVAADGSGPPQVLLKGAKMIPCDWSADGHLVFMNFERGRPSLDVYSAADHQVTRADQQGAEAQFSPDGKWIAYTGSGGRSFGDIAVQPFPGPGGRIQISNAGGAQPRWSRDGRQIFYIAQDKKLMVASFDSRKGSAGVARMLFQTRIVGAKYVLFQYDLAPDGRFLINSLPADYSSPLTLITGWTAQLRR